MDSMPFYVPVLPALSTKLLLVPKRCMNNLKFLATKIMKEWFYLLWHLP